MNRESLATLRAFLLAIGVCASVGAAVAGETLDRVRMSGTLRVCIWPDYYGITYRHPHSGKLSGLDADLSAAFAADLKLGLEHVDSSFATLVEDLRADRCDVAMFAVAMLPQRLQELRFTRPYLSSDIYAITTRGSKVVREWSDIDKPGVVVGVQSGTFMEPVMRQSLRHARLAVVRAPATRERELAAGRIDVFMTDYPYSRKLLDSADWAHLVAPPTPFHPLPYGYAVKPGDEAWYEQVDTFVRRIQRDGRLLDAARRHGLSAIVAR